MNNITKIFALILALSLTVSMLSCADTSKDTDTDTETLQTETETQPVHTHTFANELCKDTPCTACGETVEPTHEYRLVSDTQANLYECATSTYKCTNCENEKTVDISEVLSPEELRIPVVYFTGSLDGISKENELVLEVEYKSEDVNFSSYVKMKVQGNTTQYLPKKNFTVKFYEDEACTDKNKVNLGWGKEYKYCMKANATDPSQARNVVAAQLYAQIVAERISETDELASLAPNYGAIDGYPVLMYLNGEFYGLYTMNIPKDNWMMGMDEDENTRQAIIMAGNWTESCKLREPIPDGVPAESGWEIEFCSTSDSAWITESFNEFIKFLNENDGNALKEGLPDYIDVDAAIDVLIYVYFICGWDNIMNNFMWITYDGELWIPTVYDLDHSWGLWPTNVPTFGIDDMLPQISEDGTLFAEEGVLAYNLLWHKLLKNYTNEIKLRYFELRAGVLATENVEKTFSEFFSKIPDIAYTSDAARWEDMQGAEENHLEKIMSFTKQRAALLYDVFSRVNK